MPDLLANLNPEQLAAVTLPNEPALILAGAGSGKTRVLITRIAWLIQQGYASPPTILAVTFTNKAAREMMARLSALLPIDTRGMWIGTFHGLCNRMLRAHYRDAGLPQTFQILDTADQLSAIKRLMKGLNIDDEKYPAKNLQYFINNAKEQGLRPKDVDATDSFNRKFVELYEAYDQQCQREGVVDFPELLLRCYELLAHNPPLRAHYQARFRQHSRRRVPGHQQAAIRVAQAARGRAQRDLRGRRRRPVDLRVSRRERRQHARLRARVQRAQSDQARAELPLARPYSRHREPADREQLAAARQESAHRRGSRRAGARLRSRDRFAGSGLDRRGNQGADQHRPVARRDRDAVPEQRAVAHDRTHARERGHSRIACTAACGFSSARK